jgi:DNA-binding NtrC family response regulator
MGYTWPGNVRELRNIIERAVLLSEDKKLQMKDFSNLIDNSQIVTQEYFNPLQVPSSVIRLDINYGVTNLRKLDKQYAREVLLKLGGNKTQTARLLGISRPKLDTLLKNQN